MISSISSNSTLLAQNRIFSNSDSSTSVAVTGAETTTQEVDENTQVSSDGDTLTLSTNIGKTFSATSASHDALAAGELSEEGGYGGNAAAIASAAAGIGIDQYTELENEMNGDTAALGSGSSSSSSSSSSLSQYSESELKQMLENGEITQAEYNAEIKSRTESEATSAEDEEDQTVAATAETEA